MNSFEIMSAAVKALDSKKGIDITAVNVSSLTAVAEYIVIASGGSNTQVNALAEETQEALSLAGTEPHHIEGRSGGWILLDYPGVIVNIMDVKNRAFYDLERLWADGEQVDIKDILK